MFSFLIGYVYNLTNKECQAAFHKYTSETKMLSSTIDEEGDIDQVIDRFIKKVNGSIALNFKKVRINKNRVEKNDTLYDKMRQLKDKTDQDSMEELNKVKEAIAEQQNSNLNKLKEELSKVKHPEGKIDAKQLWKLKKRLCPKLVAAPSAMKDASGNFIRSAKALQERALDVYSKRLKGNIIKSHLKELEEDVNTLFEIRVQLSKSNKAVPWTIEDLKEALKHLKKDKARDPEGHSNDIFKEGWLEVT